MKKVLSTKKKSEILRYILDCYKDKSIKDKSAKDMVTIVPTSNYIYAYDKKDIEIFKLVSIIFDDYALVDMLKSSYDGLVVHSTDTLIHMDLIHMEHIDIIKTIEANKDIINLYNRDITLI